MKRFLPELKTVLPNADFVIEGYVDPTEPLRDEGPFGDHTGYYTLPEPYPVFHVTTITHRKDAIYPATIVGIPPMEDFYIGGASVKLFLPIFKMNFPEIVDIALPARRLPLPRLREHQEDLPDRIQVLSFNEHLNIHAFRMDYGKFQP